MVPAINSKGRKALIKRKTENLKKTKIERLNDYMEWWENVIHGNYIKDQQFDRIVQKM